jgi:hypothetical protein
MLWGKKTNTETQKVDTYPVLHGKDALGKKTNTET